MRLMKCHNGARRDSVLTNWNDIDSTATRRRDGAIAAPRPSLTAPTD